MMYPGSPVPICSCHFCGHLLVCFQFRWTQIFILLGHGEGHHLQSISNHSTELDEEEKVQENGQHVYWPQPTSWNLFLSLVEPIFFRFVGGFWPKPQHMKFPGQGSNSSHSCDNAKSLPTRPLGPVCILYLQYISPVRLNLVALLEQHGSGV